MAETTLLTQSGH